MRAGARRRGSGRGAVTVLVVALALSGCRTTRCPEGTSVSYPFYQNVSVRSYVEHGVTYCEIETFKSGIPWQGIVGVVSGALVSGAACAIK